MLLLLRKLSLMKQIVFLILLMLIILLVSFGISDIIAKQIIEKKVTESVEQIMFVVDEKMDSFHADMQGISTFLFYSPTIQSFLNTDDDLTRILTHREVLSMFFNTISMKENIRGIQLYDAEGKLLARIGEGDNSTGIEIDEAMSYTGLLKLDTRPSEKFYAITTPVYGLDSNLIVTDIKGTGRYFMDVSNFAPILERAKMTPSAQVMLLDSNNNTIASEGNLNYDEPFNIAHWINTPNYIVQTLPLPYSEWNLVSIIPREELLNDLNIIERFNIMTYGVMFIILCLFLIIFFNRILKPIKGLLDFVKSYPKQGEHSRFNVVHHNEIGVLGTSLNKMLDEINDLSNEVNNIQRRMYEVELSKKQMEVSAFRNQINPHFLYNTLESIRAVAFYYGVSEIAGISESLANMFRYAVKANSFVAVKDEIRHVEEYARIIDFRFRGRLQVRIDIEDELRDARMLKMLLQPLVENAVFHGLERKVGEGTVQLEIKRMASGLIHITIRDDGFGMDNESLLELSQRLERYGEPEAMREPSKKGIGMMNIYRRIKLFYGDAADMIIESRLQEGTCVTVVFPEEPVYEE
jgi:two-component system sensor histidine kinase YesM